MKMLLILVLLVIVAGGLAFTRPTSDDFKQYTKDHPEIVRGQTAVGDSLADKLAHQVKSFAASGDIATALDPVQNFLSQCTFDNNYYLWTNVSQNGQVIYTGAVGHWFKRAAAATPAATK